MKKLKTFFTIYKQYGLEGYFIPVKNTFNNCIEEEFIPKKARAIYEESYGQEMISDQEFLDWYTTNSADFQ